MTQNNGTINALNRLIETIKAQKTTPTLDVYSNTSRPAPSTMPAGYTFFNSDDNYINVSDGTNWRDPTGAIT